MAGNKNSGRRPVKHDNVIFAVLDKAWYILRDALNDETLDPKERRDIAKALAMKSVPQTMNTNISAEVTNMPVIQKSGEANDNNRISDFIVGSHEPKQLPA